VSGHARQIAFEAVDIEQERGGRDLVAVHGVDYTLARAEVFSRG
jgi:hypothetical protein